MGNPVVALAGLVNTTAGAPVVKLNAWLFTSEELSLFCAAVEIVPVYCVFAMSDSSGMKTAVVPAVSSRTVPGTILPVADSTNVKEVAGDSMVDALRPELNVTASAVFDATPVVLSAGLVEEMVRGMETGGGVGSPVVPPVMGPPFPPLPPPHAVKSSAVNMTMSHAHGC